MTVSFHVDNQKLIHKRPKVLVKTITCLKQEYESISEDISVEITVHQGKIHNYLGMTLDYTEGSTLKVSMIDYIDIIISEFDKE